MMPSLAALLQEQERGSNMDTESDATASAGDESSVVTQLKQMQSALEVLSNAVLTVGSDVESKAKPSISVHRPPRLAVRTDRADRCDERQTLPRSDSR